MTWTRGLQLRLDENVSNQHRGNLQPQIQNRGRKQYTRKPRIWQHDVLPYARIFIRPGPPPKEVQPQIDDVIEREISGERKNQLSHITEILSSDFNDVLIRPSREDDCIEPIYRALHFMDSERKLEFPRKTGIVKPVHVA